MQTLLEFAPLIAFLIAYRLADIYVATATLMIAMLALLAFVTLGLKSFVEWKTRRENEILPMEAPRP